MDTRRGLVCNLTDDYATFEHTCPDFKQDPRAAKREEKWKDDITDTEMKGDDGTPLSASYYVLLGIGGLATFGAAMTFFVEDARIARTALLLVSVIFLTIANQVHKKSKKK